MMMATTKMMVMLMLVCRTLTICTILLEAAASCTVVKTALR